MADIFISYSKEDRPRARTLAEALEQRGFSVWWDRKIPVGKSFQQVIQEAVDEARCIVVIWSEHSVKSDWVQNEAEEGKRRNILTPVMLDEVKIPLGFRHLQAANLTNWQIGQEHAEFEGLLESIRNVMGSSAGVPSPRPAAQPKVSAQPLRVSAEEPTRPIPSKPVETVEPAPRPEALPVERRRPQAPAGLRNSVVLGAATVIVVVMLVIAFSPGSDLPTVPEPAPDPSVVEPEPEPEPEPPLRVKGAPKVPRETNAPTVESEPVVAVPALPPVSHAAAEYKADPALNAPPSSALTGPVFQVQWMDHAISYAGTLHTSDTSAEIRASLHDVATGTLIGNYAVNAQVVVEGGQGTMISGAMISAEFTVPGDSATPGTHTHVSNLFLTRDVYGNPTLMNCPRQGECYPGVIGPQQ
jgi:hypothetical protein